MRTEPPERLPNDGAIELNRLDGMCGVHIHILVEDEKENNLGDILLSEFNACRLLGMLSVMLDLPLTKQAQKMIRL